MKVRLAAALCGVSTLLAFSPSLMPSRALLQSTPAVAPTPTASTPRPTASPPRTAVSLRHPCPRRQPPNGRSVVVRINDRGPFVHGRIIDLTPAGARALGFSGLAPSKSCRCAAKWTIQHQTFIRPQLGDRLEARRCYFRPAVRRLRGREDGGIGHINLGADKHAGSGLRNVAR